MGLCASRPISVAPHSSPDARTQRVFSALTVTDGDSAREALPALIVSPPPGCFSPGAPPSPSPLALASPQPASAAAPAALPPPLALPLDAEGAQQRVSAAVGAGGAAAVLSLMRLQPLDAELQWWCCDALAGLMAGAAEVREGAFAGGALGLALAAMARFAFVEELQARGCWVLGALAASYAGEVGEGGGLEACRAALQSCPEAYSVLAAAVRALTNLVAAPAPAGPANAARAAALGLAGDLAASLEANPGDGQLQWKGRQLMGKLDRAAAAGAGAERGSSLGGQAPAVLDELGEATRLKEAQEAQLPGRSGPSKVVVQALHRGGVRELCLLLTGVASELEGETGAPRRVVVGGEGEGQEGQDGEEDALTERRTAALEASAELAYWACDALHGAMREDKAARRTAVLNDLIPSIFSLLRSRSFDERLIGAGLTMLTSVAGDPAFSTLVGTHLPQVLQHLDAARVSLPVQHVGVKLISLLLLECECASSPFYPAHARTLSVLTPPPNTLPLSPSLSLCARAASGENLRIAREHSAVRVIKELVARQSDPHLSFRGINLLERLEANSTTDMVKQAMIRSQSMRADEMARFFRSAAESFVSAGAPEGGSSRFRESMRESFRVDSLGSSRGSSSLITSSTTPRALESVAETQAQVEGDAGPGKPPTGVD